MVDRIRVGLIGYGIGKLYAASLLSLGAYYADMPPVEFVTVSTTSEETSKEAMKQFGFKRYTTDYREILADEEINTVIIATPNSLHRDMLIAALQTNKAIYMDKPLANNLAEAREIVTVARQYNHDAHLSFVDRYCPALQQARKLVQDGRLGDIYSFRLSYYRSSYIDPQKPLRWKAKMATSGGGVLNDLVPHLADQLFWLIGTPERLSAQTRTFIKERPVAKGSAERVAIETDDHVIIQAALSGGAIGTIEASRLITGALNDTVVEVYGSKGSLRWSLMNPNYLSLVEQRMPADERGWLDIPVAQRYPDAVLPGPDVPVGGFRFYVASVADFIRKANAPMRYGQYDPGLDAGLRVQALIEAATQSAASEGTWINVQPYSFNS